MDDASTKRAPRPRLLYPSLFGVHPAEIEMRFTILALGDYTLRHNDWPLGERKPTRVDREGFDRFMAEQRLELGLGVADRLSDEPGVELSVKLRFKLLSDFTPDAIVNQVPEMRMLLERRRALASLRGSLHNNRSFRRKLQGLLGDVESREVLMSELGVALPNALPPRWVTSGEPRSLIDELLQNVNCEPDQQGFDVVRFGVICLVTESLAYVPHDEFHDTTADQRDYASLNETFIASIDDRLAAQTDEILHHPDFQRLESAWRALRYLVDHADACDNVRVEVLQCSKEDLAADFEDAPDIATSGLLRLLSVGKGLFGFEPVGLMVADYEFAHDHADIALLMRISAVAARARAPFVAGVSCRMFDFDDWQRFPGINDLMCLFEGPQYARWQAFRESEEARYVGLCLPRFMAREPYTEGSAGARAFRFVEDVTGGEVRGRSRASGWQFKAQPLPLPERYLWGNAAFLFAARVAASFARCGLPSEVVGLEGGGFVGGLARHRYEANGVRYTSSPLEAEVSIRREYELAEEGLIGLVYQEVSGGVTFLSARSCRKWRYFGALEISQRIQYGAACRLSDTLLASRVAHYIERVRDERSWDRPEWEVLARDLAAWLSALSEAGAKAEAPSGSAPFRAATIVRVVSSVEELSCEVELTPYDTYDGTPYTIVVRC